MFEGNVKEGISKGASWHISPLQPNLEADFVYGVPVYDPIGIISLRLCLTA
jgi:hypothetical protein